MPIKCTPLGAGQDVGKSCVIVNLGGKTVMFDCGVHMGYQDERRYPDFSMITKSGNYTQAIDCVIVTHFHLDHIGALPYFTEVCGYEGPIYMTYPTKALAPLMLEDYRKVMVDRKGEQEQFSAFQIQQCIKKVIPVDLRQTVTIDEGFELRGYYAGHVLGAAMFYVRAGEETVVYTGDYNMTPDRHLGAAQIDRLRPDLLITESTYATTIRDSKLARERDFLKAVHSCISAGGKVLIPVFALGRAQELCILLDEYWERTNLKAPIYFSAGLTMQANIYYKLLISWTNQKVKDTYVTRNTFDFKHVSPFERSQIDAPGPCVLFATPGMLSGGLSLEVFKHWAPSELNMIILPGFCVAGTVGYKLMSGKPTRIDLDKRTQLDVRCQVNHLSFSAHTDAKGIMDLVEHVAPRHVVLVHGEKPKMASLKGRIITELNIPCYDPANHETINIPPRDSIKVSISKQFLLEATPAPVPAHQHIYGSSSESGKTEREQSEILPPVQNKITVEGLLVSDSNSGKQVLHPTEVAGALGLEQHKLRYSSLCPIYLCGENETEVDEQLPVVDRPMEVSEFPRRLYEPSTTTQKQSLDKEATPEPEQKRSKRNLQRVLSLDLERLPEAEEGDEICLDLERAPLEQSEQRPGNLGAAHSRGSSSNVRIDLDINVVPDLTLMDCSPRLSDSPEISSSSILRGVYLALAKWLGLQVMEQTDCVKGGRTLSIRISPQPLSDSGLELPGRSDSNKLIALVECTWGEEDDHLAQRAVSILHSLKFKPE